VVLFAQTEGVEPKVTFIELGSVNCIPCKQMQPVMKSIEEKYGEQVKVIFYDVWKQEQKKYAQQYGIRLIPTQVFLDENGNEFHRHEGFYPEAEIDKILKAKGLKPQDKKSQND
jgi:thioredoxin 1